jgi:hypothetical protein
VGFWLKVLYLLFYCDPPYKDATLREERFYVPAFLLCREFKALDAKLILKATN